MDKSLMLLSNNECQALIMAMMNGSGGMVSDERLSELLSWCNMTNAYALMIELATHGEVMIEWPEGEPAPIFRLATAEERAGLRQVVRGIHGVREVQHG